MLSDTHTLSLACTQTRADTLSLTHAHSLARTHMRMHARTHIHTHTHICMCGVHIQVRPVDMVLRADVERDLLLQEQSRLERITEEVLAVRESECGTE